MEIHCVEECDILYTYLLINQLSLLKGKDVYYSQRL